MESQGKTQVEKRDIDYYCFGLVEGDAFKIFDQLFVSSKLAVQSIEKMQEDGKNWNEVQGLLLWGLKIYLTLLEYDKMGIRSAKEIIAEAKLHPFVVNKNLKYLAELRKHERFLIQFFKGLIDLEYAIKTAKYPDSYYWPMVKNFLLQLP